MEDPRSIQQDYTKSISSVAALPPSPQPLFSSGTQISAVTTSSSWSNWTAQAAASMAPDPPRTVMCFAAGG